MIMPNTKLLIFGNPKAGTPLMLAGSEHRHRSAAEDPRSWGRRRRGVYLVQQRSVPGRTARHLARYPQEPVSCWGTRGSGSAV